MEKAKDQSRVVVPFTGYLHPQLPPEPEPPKQTTSLLTIAALLFVAGLAIGGISVYQSTDFTQIENLKAQAKQLSEVKKNLCH